MRGEPGALIDACIHLATIDNLHMQFDVVIIISTEHNTVSVPLQATVQLASYMRIDHGLKKRISHEKWDINSKVITVD